MIIQVLAGSSHYIPLSKWWVILVFTSPKHFPCIIGLEAHKHDPLIFYNRSYNPFEDGLTHLRDLPSPGLWTTYQSGLLPQVTPAASALPATKSQHASKASACAMGRLGSQAALLVGDPTQSMVHEERIWKNQKNDYFTTGKLWRLIKNSNFP